MALASSNNSSSDLYREEKWPNKRHPASVCFGDFSRLSRSTDVQSPGSSVSISFRNVASWYKYFN